jgi:streptogramin lyase
MVLPQIVLNTLGTTLVSPAGLAFDADGNLWVSNAGNQTLVSFTPAQLAVSGRPVPNVTISSNNGSLDVPTGLAFDSGGSLWVINSTGVLEKFPKASLVASGATAPSVRLAVTGFMQFWNVAFWPKVAGLPLN